MKKTIRILSVFLAVLMCMGMAAIAVSAAKAGLDNFSKSKTYSTDQFTDVNIANWYYDDVKTAYEYGLMIGRGGKAFGSADNINLAEAITLAARINKIYNTGVDSFKTTTPWYDAYVDYAVTQGIIKNGDFADYSKAATRAQFAYILSGALPDSVLTAINSVADDSIPDVRSTAKYADEIYRLYRAGVIVGIDSEGTYAPNTNIKRVEVAAIATRMVVESMRKSITLGDDTINIKFVYNYSGKLNTLHASKYIDRNSKVTAPSTPTRTGYTFDGWYTEAACKNKFDFKTVLKVDTTLYAGWTDSSTYTVEFKLNYTGAPNVSSQLVEAGSTVTRIVDPSRSNYIFVDWYTDSACTKPFDFDTKITEDTVLYAGWADYLVKFVYVNANGNEVTILKKGVYSNTKVSEPADPKLSGMIFKGWYTDKNCTEEFDFSDKINEDTTVYAKWAVKVTYMLNYGSAGEYTTQEVVIGTAPGAIASPTRPTDITFKGWYTDKEFKKAFDETKALTSGVTVYARWVGVVTYDDNTETADVTGMRTNNEINEGEKIGAITDKPARENYIFDGWYTDAACTVAFDTEKTPVEKNMTLYVKWNVKVNFNYKDGSNVVEKELKVTSDNKISEPDDPTRTDYIFKGWFTDEGCTSEFDFANTQVTPNMTLFAKWEAKTPA